MVRLKSWLRKIRNARGRARQQPIVPRLEPLEDRTLLFCYPIGVGGGAHILAVSTHVVGDWHRAALEHTDKPVALVENSEGEVSTMSLRDALNLPNVTGPAGTPALSGVAQGMDAFESVARGLGIPAPYTSVDHFHAQVATSGPLAGPPGGGLTCGLPQDTVPICDCDSDGGGANGTSTSGGHGILDGGGLGGRRPDFRFLFGSRIIPGGNGGSSGGSGTSSGGDGASSGGDCGCDDGSGGGVGTSTNGGGGILDGGGLRKRRRDLLSSFASGMFSLPSQRSLSRGPIRYFDGVVDLETSDLASDGFGIGWGQTRAWTNGIGYMAGNLNGTGTVLSQQPHLIQVNAGNTIVVVSNGINSR